MPRPRRYLTEGERVEARRQQVKRNVEAFRQRRKHGHSTAESTNSRYSSQSDRSGLQGVPPRTVQSDNDVFYVWALDANIIDPALLTPDAQHHHRQKLFTDDRSSNTPSDVDANDYRPNPYRLKTMLPGASVAKASIALLDTIRPARPLNKTHLISILISTCKATSWTSSQTHRTPAAWALQILSSQIKEGHRPCPF